MKVYIVGGSKGEYDDHSEWNVKTFLSHEKAQEFLKKLEDWCAEKKIRVEEARSKIGSPNNQTGQTWEEFRKINGEPNPYDNMTSDYEVDYYIQELELEE